MKLTLSFDNGPHPEGTPKVLKCLERRGLKAFFFALGRHIHDEPGRGLAQRILAEGHTLGNHSYSHEIPLGRDQRSDAVELELARTQRLLEALGATARLFRPFGGGGAVGPHLFSPAAVHWLREARMTCVLWNSVPGDFRDPDGWVLKALEDIPSRPHTLLVLHDAKPKAMERLDEFLDQVEAAGHELSADLPDDCILMDAGIPRARLSTLTGEVNEALKASGPSPRSARPSGSSPRDR